MQQHHSKPNKPPRSMVWKIRRSNKESTVAAPVGVVRGKPIALRSCLKKGSGHERKNSCGSSKHFDSTSRDHSTRSGGSGSLESKSADSRLSTVSASQALKRDVASEQRSLASGSSGSSGIPLSPGSGLRASSQASEKSRASSQASEKSRASSQSSGEKSASSSPQEKQVRFSEIHVRDYERVVGDNPSCSAGPPIG